MDKTGKLFGKISVIDLAVILLIIALAAAGIYRFTASGATMSRGDATVNFTIRIEGVREFTADYYHEGLRVYDRRQNQFIGNITNVRTEPHYTFQALEDGTLIRALWPDHTVIFIDIKAQGRRTPSAIFVEGTYEITANSIIYIHTRYIQVQGVIYSISVQE